LLNIGPGPMECDMSKTNTQIFMTLFTAVFVTTMGAGFVAPLLPVYAHDLGAGGFEIGLIFAAFSLTRTLFVPYFGKLSDRRGKKGLLTTGLLLYFLLAILYVLLKGIVFLILLRLAQGFASAMILPVAQAYVGDITPRLKEGRVMGLFNLSLYGGLSAGPVLGGVVRDSFNSMQAAFMGMGILTCMGFILCLLFLPPEKQESEKKGGFQTQVHTGYLVLLRSRAVFSLFAFRSCFTTCIGMVWAFLPLLASNRLNLSSSAIGIVVMINVFVSGLLQVPMGYLADRYSKKTLIIGGGLAGILAILYLNHASSLAQLLLANALFGLSGGISFPAIMAAGVIEGRRHGAMGAVMGILALGHSLGMLAGPLLAGGLLDFFPRIPIFWVGAGIIGLGTVITCIDAPGPPKEV
jgi:MFS transporter, DHA1 family, multidrug resistance protein